MGWMRTILLGDIGNRLDIEDTERDIAALRSTQQVAQRTLQESHGEIRMLKNEIARQKLTIEALTRFLIHKGIIHQAELDEFIREVDAEDGAVDGRMEFNTTTKRLQFPHRSISPGSLRPGQPDDTRSL